MKAKTLKWKFAAPDKPLGKMVDILLVAGDGWYVATVAQLPGAISQGRTKESAIRNIKDALRQVLKAYREMGKPTPWRKGRKPLKQEISVRFEIPASWP